MLKMRFLIICLLFATLQKVVAQCDDIRDFGKKVECLVYHNKNDKIKIRDLQNKIVSLKKDKISLQKKVQYLQEELNKSRDTIAYLRGRGNRKNPIDTTKFVSKISRIEQDNKDNIEIIKQQTIEIEALRRDSINFETERRAFLEKNYIFDDNFVVPYELPIAPTSFYDDGRLDPTTEVNEFLTRLSKIKDCSVVRIIVNIRGNGREQKKIRERIKTEIEQHYKIKCEVTYEFKSENKNEINFQIIKIIKP
jgi:hypothetical protein